MPKMKTDRGAAKRFKVTGTGRLRRRQANRSHLLEKKTQRPHASPGPRGRGRRRRPSRSAAPARSVTTRRAHARPPRNRRTGRGARDPMSFTKGAGHGQGEARRQRQEAPSRRPRVGAGLLRQPEPHLPFRQRGGHALAAVRVPRPSGAQGGLPAAVDPAHQRRRPGPTARATAGSSPGCARPRSSWTARCSPIWPSPTPRRSPAWWAWPRPLWPTGRRPRWRRRPGTAPDHGARLPAPAGPAPAPAAGAAQHAPLRGGVRGRRGQAPRTARSTRARRSRRSSSTTGPGRTPTSSAVLDAAPRPAGPGSSTWRRGCSSGWPTPSRPSPCWPWWRCPTPPSTIWRA